MYALTADDKRHPSITRILVVHDAALPIPKGWALRVRVIADRAGWPVQAPGDVVVWDRAPESLRVEGVPPGLRLWSPSSAVVEAAREAGWGEVVLLPDLSASTLRSALEDQLVSLEGATLLPRRGELWVSGRVIRLPPRERELLGALAASPDPVPRDHLLAGGTPEALEATLARLRRRVGAPVILADGRAGWRLLTSAPRPAAQPAVAPAGVRSARADDRPIPLTAREAALFDLLVRAPGGVLRREFTRTSLGLDDAALDTIAHRLRRRLGSERLRTVRGVGWSLDVPPGAKVPETPIADAPRLLGDAALEEMVRRHPLVTVVGSAGRELVVSLARHQRWACFDVSGLAIERVLRWVERRSDQVVLEGFDDPSPWASVLAGLVSEGRRLLISAAAPLGHPSEVVLASGSVQDAAASAAAALAIDPDLARALAVLAAFGGPFDAADVQELTPGFDPAPAARLGLLQSRDGVWMMPGATRAALPEAKELDRWAVWVAHTVRRDLHRRACPKERLTERIPDLVRAARHLVARGDAAGVGATVDWGQIGRWVGSAPNVEDVTAALSVAEDDEARAALLVVATESNFVDQSSVLEFTSRAETLARSGATRWLARLIAANHQDDRSDPRIRSCCRALLAEADDPSDPAPPDVRSMLVLLSTHTTLRPEDHIAVLIDSLLRIEAHRWSPADTTPGIWLDDARAATLSELANEFLSIGDLEHAEAAIIDGLRVASPDAVALLGLTRGLVLARSARWPEADRVLDELCWSPTIRETPMSHARVLGWRALLAALHGPRALAAALTDQLEVVAWRTGATFVDRQLHQIRAWFALDDADLPAFDTHVDSAYPPGDGELMRVASRYLAGTCDLAELVVELRASDAADTYGLRAAFLRRFPELRVD